MRAIVFFYYTVFSFATMSCFAVLNKLQEGYYGIAGGCIVFALTFLVLAIKNLPGVKNTMEARVNVLELIGLFTIATIFFLKTFQILFLGINTVHLIAISILLVATIAKLLRWIKVKNTVRQPVFFANLILTISYLVFLIGDVLLNTSVGLFVPLVFVGLALGILAIIYIVYVRSSHFVLSGKKIVFFDVEQFRGYWLFLAYILFFSYQLAVDFNVTDKVYFKRMPQKYIELFYQAETGKEEPVDGKYQFEIYKEEYDKLLEKNL